MTADGWIVSAYCAAPALVGWDPGAEGRFLDAVGALPGVAGLEIPFSGRLHPHSEDWFLRRDHTGDYTITTIPDTMHRIDRDPAYGLASLDDWRRRVAVARTGQVAAAVRRVNQAAGRRAVRSVTVYSAPRLRTGHASVRALVTSLVEIAEFDWDGARLVLEHCDAPVGSRPAVKGFLSLESEVAAVRRANGRLDEPIGVVVNWGRSVVERRRPEAAVAQVLTARAAGVLAGVVLSGCAPVDTGYGPAWDDVHVPPSTVCPLSLLTPAWIAATLRAAGPGPVSCGLKVSAPRGATLATRIATVSRSLAACAAARFDGEGPGDQVAGVGSSMVRT
ncbi:DUF4862 family protein [Nocardia sp. NPDC004582]